ncbi:uncharacterized protein LOC141530302 [Cotesia typhae]|uniref:uncharacterized protein LOC141530302 n=1 Tax=Cotesia typhae TaxID=2053667 RepID=UPI003D684912
MGSHKKRSRSRDHSSERTSKRLRKLEDRMEEIATGFAAIREAILSREAPQLEMPNTDTQVFEETKEPEQDPAANQHVGSEKSQVIELDPPTEETENQKDGSTEVGGSSAGNVKDSATSAADEIPWELDADGLRIFGEDPAQKEPELILHSSVAIRWKKYLSEGLKKEVKDSLMEKYPRKDKLSFEPPILNDEVAVNLKESALKRDKYFGATQKLAGSALAALAPAIESLAPLRDAESMKRLKQIWDAAKLLIEIRRSQTVARKACILPTLSKQWATALGKRVTDNYLFGENLVDKVKEIKAIGKVDEEMKSAPVKKIFVSPGPLNAKSSLSQKKSVTQTGGRTSVLKKPLTSRLPPKQSTYPKSSQYRQQNQRSQNQHFKLEDLRSACSLLEQGMFMGTIDLKDAYFLIPVWKPHCKFLRFSYNEKIYEFVCLPFGLCTCPLTFTKLLKPVINYLRFNGWISVVYLDDFLCLGQSIGECSENLTETIVLRKRLGFIVNYEKSKLVPEKKCKYLGFILDSVSMKIELPHEKKIAVRNQIESLKKKRRMKIRDFAKVVGSLVACCPAVEYSLLHCRLFEKAKIQALNRSKGCFDDIMSVPKFTIRDWDWWLQSLPNATRKIRNNRYEKTIYSDASLSGWGAFCNGEDTPMDCGTNRKGVFI